MKISIVGMQYAKSQKIVETIPVGAPLELRREPDNQFDKNAVAVFYGAVKIGYLPKTHNAPVAIYMNLGGNATATFTRSPNSKYPQADVTLEPANVEPSSPAGPAGELPPYNTQTDQDKVDNQNIDPEGRRR